MASNSVLIHKLQRALNTKGMKILYSTTQFYSEEQDRPVTMYIVKRAVYDEQKGRNQNIELFKSTSQIQIVLFLRDLWYEVNGKEVPKDNEKWNAAKEKQLQEKEVKSSGRRKKGNESNKSNKGTE